MTERLLTRGTRFKPTEDLVKDSNGKFTLGEIYTVHDETSSVFLGWTKDDEGDIYCIATKEVIVISEDPRTPAQIVEHQQDIVSRALDMFVAHDIFRQNHFGMDPTVVGGAPRDWDYGIPAQDIDIWCKNLLYGEDHLDALRNLFEPLGATVGKVTDNTYARDGEYIHYIFNVVWEGVDLQFIFVEDPSVEAVIKHVCCNFSEISWDWKHETLQPTYKYKAGRMSKVLIFSDDKGRSPRDKYIEKMAKRYPDHSIVLPVSCGHLQSKYSDRVCDPEMDLKEPDGTWGTPNSFTAKYLEDLKEGDWVVATEDFESKQSPNNSIRKGVPYQIIRTSCLGSDGEGFNLRTSEGCAPYYTHKRFRMLAKDEKVVECVEDKQTNLVSKGKFYVATPYSSRGFHDEYYNIYIHKRGGVAGMSTYRFKDV